MRGLRFGCSGVRRCVGPTHVTYAIAQCLDNVLQQIDQIVDVQLFNEKFIGSSRTVFCYTLRSSSYASRYLRECWHLVEERCVQVECTETDGQSSGANVAYCLFPLRSPHCLQATLLIRAPQRIFAKLSGDFFRKRILGNAFVPKKSRHCLEIVLRMLRGKGGM